MANLTLMDLLQQAEDDTTQVPRTDLENYNMLKKLESKRNDEKIMWIMRPIIERMMIQNSNSNLIEGQTFLKRIKGDTTNKATDIGKQTLNDIFGNKSAEADSIQQDYIRRLSEAGPLGIKGKAIVDKLTFDPSDTGPIFGENPTTELDSLQRDAVDRLRSGGPFGKQGRRLRDWFESIDWGDIFEEIQNRGFTSVGPMRRPEE